MQKPAQTVIAGIRQRLQPVAPFAQMESEHLDRLIAASEMVYFEPGQVILAPTSGVADCCHLIDRGVVRGERPDPSGVSAATWELNAGEMFPIGALLAQRPATTTYRAVGDVFCLRLPRAEFDALVAQSVVFKDFCTRRIASLLDLSRQQLQAAYVAESASQQGMETRLADLGLRPPVCCDAQQSLRAVLALMHAQRVGAMLVTDAAHRPQGIFTRSDLLKLAQAPTFDRDQTVGTCMRSPVIGLSRDSTAGDAAMLMATHGVRHLAVLDGEALCGVVSERDLFSLQRLSLQQVMGAIRRASDRAQLVRAASDIRALSRGLVAQGVGAAQLTRFISSLNDQLTRRVLECVATQHPLDDVRWCWLAFGSEGRHEQTISTDQDNGLIYECGPGQSAGNLRERMLAFGGEVNRWLADCGFPLCKGGVMAGQPACCHTPEQWRQQFEQWIRHCTPQSLLSASIYFDFRPLAGQLELAHRLRAEVVALAREQQIFLRLLAGNALRAAPPLNWLGRLAGGGEQGIDLKLHGTMPFVDGARVLALAAGVEATSTSERLQAAMPVLRLDPESVRAWADAFHFLQLLRLRHQHRLQADDAQAHGGGPNHVNPHELSEVDRRILKEAFRQIRKLQHRLRVEFAMGGG